MKFWEVYRRDLNWFSGCEIGQTLILRSADKDSVDKFVKDWEERWQKNRDNRNSEVGCCWIDCEGKLIVEECMV